MRLIDRRGLIAAAAGLGWTALAAPAWTQGKPRPAPAAKAPRNLEVFNANTKEWFRGEYHDGTAVIAKAAEELNWFLRDHRENKDTRMDEGVYEILWRFQEGVRRAGMGRHVFVTSAFRTEKTNAALRSEGAARNSLHMSGRAVDLIVPGHGSLNYETLAERVWRGGVGLYHCSGFVHFDTGNLRGWGQPPC
jgi:uncharacterized protein YcbK (DUF882 family)